MKLYIIILCLIASIPLQAGTGSEPPNIIVLFADDMGYGDLSSYGHPTIRTPNLDRMAQEGLRLTSFYCAAPVCSPSRAALLTGRYPIHAGMPGNTGPNSSKHLPLDQILLPQVLRQAGYTTGMVGKWHLGHQSAEVMPTGRGFDFFFGLPYSNDMIKPWVNTDKSIFLYQDADPIEEMPDQRFLTTRYTKKALEFIEGGTISEQPFFLYVAYSMPHLPVSTTDERKGTSRAGLYGDVIETIDWSVGKILHKLKELGIDDQTFVVFTSDNGPWQNLPDRMLAGGVERWHAGLAGHLSGSKGTTWEGGMRVPGIFRWPGKIPAGRTSAELVTTLDLFPTILHITGNPDLPEGHDLDGYILTDFLTGKSSTSPREEFIYSFKDNFEGIRVGPWKYRYTSAREKAQLYHLDRDPSELYNVADRYPDIANRLHQRLLARAKQYGADFPGRK